MYALVHTVHSQAAACVLSYCDDAGVIDIAGEQRSGCETVISMTSLG